MKKAKKLASTNGPSSSSSSSSFSSVFENPSPSYLDGLPGNFGFDPLGIYTPEGTGVMDQTWLRYSEVYHSRWAMLGVAGCLVPEIRGDQIEWFKASYEAPYQLYAIPILLLAAAEYLRIKDFWEPRCKIPSDTPPEGEEWWEEAFTSCATGDPIYPGGPLFNFLQIVRDKSSNLSDFKESEVVAGRIAMVAFVGFVVQGVAGSGVSGPYGDLLRHLDDPIGENFVTLLLEKNAAAAKAVAESSVEGSSVKEALSNGIGGPNAAPLVKDGVTRLGYQMNLLE